jgi:hypothetical protein
MKKQMSKRLAGLMLMLMFSLCLSALPGSRAQAASGRAYFNDPSVTQGDTVNITMTVECSDSGLGSMDATLVYDTSLLEFVIGDGPSNMAINGESGSVSISWYDASGPGSISCNLTFRAVGVGTATVQPSYIEVISVDEEAVSLSSNGSSAVTISAPVTASSEARLSGLQIAPGALTPGFSPDVYEYHTTVASDVEKLVVSASTMDANATYTVTGTRMDPGDNTTTIRVTAEDGVTVAQYVIYTVREAGEETTPEETTEETTEGESTTAAEADPMTVTVDGDTLHITPSLEGVEIPEGFEVQAYTYKDTELQAAKGLAKPLLLFWLTDAEGENGAFYVYEEAADRFYRLVNLTMNQKIYTIVPADKDLTVPAGFKETTISIGGEVVPAWIAEKDMKTNFVLVYAMNWNGEKSLYRYDSVEETFQRYVRETLGEEEKVSQPETSTDGEADVRLQKMKETYEAELKKKSQIGWVLVAICVIDTALLIYVLVLRKGRRGDEEDAEDDYEEYEEYEEEDPWEPSEPPAPRTRRADRPAQAVREELPEPAAAEPRNEEPEPAAEESQEVTEDDVSFAFPEEEAPEESEIPEEPAEEVSATAALLKELEEMERKIKSEQAPPKKQDSDEDDDGFEFVDLDD